MTTNTNAALRTIADWPITDSTNMDAVNMAQVARAALTTAAAVPAAGWWRQRADEIELEVAQGKLSAMHCYTDMRALLQAAAAPKPAPAAVAGPSVDVQAKIDSNIWDDFGDILPTLKAISRGDWFWGANSRCKYIEIRLDTRDGGCVLYDRDRVRISPEQFAFQAAGCLGKMDPWPAKNALAAPATQAAHAALGDAEDAARWRETLMHIGAANHLGGQHFTLNTLRITDQMFLLRGSVAQHFAKCIDASRAARSHAKEGA